ncbi:MAG: hypothetical protein ABIK68_00215 [bacterium]
MITGILSPVPSIAGEEKPQVAFAPVVVSSHVLESEKEMLSLFFTDLLRKSYRVVPPDRYRAATSIVFKEIRAEQCTEGYCIFKIKQLLGVERLIMLELAKIGTLFQIKITLARNEDRLVKEDICQVCSLNQQKEILRDLFRKVRMADLSGMDRTESAGTQPAEPITGSAHIRENLGLHLTLLGVFLASSWQLVDEAAKTNQLADRNRDLQELQRTAISTAQLSAIRAEYEENQGKMDQSLYQMNLMQGFMAAMILIETLILTRPVHPVKRDSVASSLFQNAPVSFSLIRGNSFMPGLHYTRTW